MTDDQDVTLARLDERGKSRDARIKKLEDNQKWAVLTILGLILNSAAQYLGGA